MPARHARGEQRVPAGHRPCHGPAAAQEQHADRGEQQQPGRQVQGPAALSFLGEARTDHDEHPEHRRRHPGQPGGGP
ncbi:hypothetical protein ABZ362_29890 [Streptomyces sp. NPDC005951]|uniref:hypothetical protein n=1 Tax=Streptomyces sp. NPDC005951 TaxID=3154573 RepID=UPI0033D6B8F5